MIEAAVQMLHGLSRRERALIGVLLALALPLGVAFGVVQPRLQARTETIERAEEAATLRRWAVEQAALYDRLVPEGEQPGAGGADGPIGLSGIEASLIEDGLRQRIDRLAEENDGRISLGFDSVNFQRLAAWLGRMRPFWGYDLVEFDFERTDEPGFVEARLVLETAA